jgi:hypothetical protein
MDSEPTVKPLVYDILEGLIRKGETVRVNLQTFHGPRAEGTLMKMVPLEELRDIRGILGKGIRIHYDSITAETTPHPLEYRLEELENHSSLRKADLGWLLTINHETRK